MWRYTVPIAIFAALTLFLWRGLSLNPTRIPSPMVGQPAPAFSLPNLHDMSATVGTDDFAGQLALVNVWGTWCPECRGEHGVLLEIAQSGEVPDDRDAALEWLATLGDPYVATAVEQEGYVAIDWGIYGAPETFLIGPDGTILHKHIAQLTREIWERDFVPLIEAHRGDG
jgi:cytochrome c biogenesis protein CcmG/thiol:disulfide interchange protein DsbE